MNNRSVLQENINTLNRRPSFLENMDTLNSDKEQTLPAKNNNNALNGNNGNLSKLFDGESLINGSQYNQANQRQDNKENSFFSQDLIDDLSLLKEKDN